MKKLLIILIIIIVIIFAVYKYAFRAPENISKADIDVTINAVELVMEFSDNLSISETKYFEKIIVVNGLITEIESEGITLNEGIFCKLNNVIDLKAGDKIKVKGLYIGYDDLFEVIKLDQCTIIE